MLYLFVCRSLPFSDGRASTQDIQKRVVKEQLTFPNSYRDPCGRDLIGRLLAKRPECRLGAGMDGLGEVKMHPFFAMQSGESLFDKLIRRELPAPIIPGGSCFTNFDEPDCHSAGITATSARGYVEDSRVACGLF